MQRLQKLPNQHLHLFNFLAMDMQCSFGYVVRGEDIKFFMRL
jgi:hypothetical protein